MDLPFKKPLERSSKLIRCPSVISSIILNKNKFLKRIHSAPLLWLLGQKRIQTPESKISCKVPAELEHASAHAGTIRTILRNLTQDDSLIPKTDKYNAKGCLPKPDAYSGLNTKLS